MLSADTLETLEQRAQELLETDDMTALQELLAPLHPADIADILDRLPDDEQVRTFRTLPLEVAAEVLAEASGETTREILSELPTEEAGDLLDQLDSDDVAEILTEDVPEQQQVLLAAMEDEEAAGVRALLAYRPQTAGRLMTDSFVRASASMNADAALQLLRDSAADTDTLGYLYIVDQRQVLEGVVSLSKLLQMAPGQRLGDVMRTGIVGVAPETDQEEVARIVSQYDLAAIPVIDGQQRIVGVITVDDVIDVLLEEGTEDVLRFGGVEIPDADETYFTVPLMSAVRQRVVWLMLLFVAGTLTSFVVGLYENELAQVIILSTFIPLIIGTGGNTGAQTVSTVIRGMALGEIRLRDAGRVLLRELSTGLVLGGILGIIALIWTSVTGQGLQIAAVVACSVLAVCVWANTIAALVPLVARRLNVDPATVSAPMISTLVDATGLAIYLSIAKVLLGL